jgi:tetratricopeptide (TPR) repeat protein
VARSVGAEGFAVDAAHMVAIAASSDGAEALTWNERALSLSESSSDPAARRWRASLLNNLGWTHHDAGRFDQALDHFERALAAREEAGAVGPIRIARWAIARALRSLGRLDEALAIQRSLAEEHAADGTSDGYVSEELGELLLAQGLPAEARPHFARAAALLGEDPWFAEAEAERLARLRDLATPEPPAL